MRVPRQTMVPASTPDWAPDVRPSCCALRPIRLQTAPWPWPFPPILLVAGRASTAPARGPCARCDSLAHISPRRLDPGALPLPARAGAGFAPLPVEIAAASALAAKLLGILLVLRLLCQLAEKSGPVVRSYKEVPAR